MATPQVRFVQDAQPREAHLHTRWRLELGDLGELPSLPGDQARRLSSALRAAQEGVLRIACGDTVPWLQCLGWRLGAHRAACGLHAHVVEPAELGGAG